MPAPGARGQKAAAERRAIFVAEYLKDFQGAKAAIAAGYSKVRAKQAADELLNRPDVAAALKQAIAERSERTQIDADWVLEHLSQKAKADLADIYMPDGRLKPVHEWPLIWRQGLVAGVKTAETDEAGVTVREVKIADRTKVDELLGKHVGVQAFRERVEHDVRVRQATDMTDAELAAIARGSGE